MKFLHSAALLRPPSGIINQMRWEHEAANELNLDWDVRLYCPTGWIEPEGFVEAAPGIQAADPNRAKLYDWVRFRHSYYRWLFSQVGNYDGFLLRYYVHDPFQLYFLRRCPKPVYLVHHTLEEPELGMSGTLPARLRSRLDHLIGVPAIKAATGIVGVTQEIVNYELGRAGISEKTTFVYPNGIKFDGGIILDKRSRVPEFLFVAGEFSSWHGLDLLLDSIARSDAEFKLHLVGNVHEPDLTRAKNDSRVFVHGRMSSEQIRSLAEACWLGLSSFGLHRKSMTEACTLKVREYLMMGLPVYAGHKDVAQDQNEFFSSGPADIDAILRIALKNRVPRQDVSDRAKASISKNALLGRLYRDLIVATVQS